MAGGIKKFRVRLKSDDRVGLKTSIGHRLSPEGMRMRHERPPPVDTPVEVQICYADGRLALVGSGWVSAIEKGETHLELEWSDAAEPDLSAWLFGQAEPPPHPTVTLDELESPDEVPLVPSEAPSSSGQRLHPDLVWELARPIPMAGEPPTEPLELIEWVGPDPYDDETPIALTDVVEQAQADLEEAGALETDRSRLPEDTRDRLSALRAEAASDVAGGDGADGAPWSGPEALTVGTLEAEPESSKPASGASSEDGENREVTPLARIELVQRDSAALPGAGDLLAAGDDAPEPPPLPRLDAPPLLDPPAGPPLAVDLGTSMTSVAVSERAGEARRLRAEPSADLLPSVVVVEEDRVFAGAPAIRVLSRRPGHGVIGTKRLLGRSFWSPLVRRVAGQLPFRVCVGPHGEVAAEIEGRALPLEEVAALLLRRATRHARAQLGAPANRAVLTCPAYYGVRQRAALASAGRLAGLHVARIVSCSVAAAVHRAPHLEPGRHRLLVFDLGAGTLDVSVVEVDGGRFTVLAAGGHALLGGIDFDAAVAQLLVVALEGTGQRAHPSPYAVSGVLDAAEEGKQALGEISRVHLPVSAAMARHAADEMSVEVARADAEALWATLVDKALSVTRDVCRRAGVAPMEIDEILVAGGQARAPYVQRRLQDFFKKPCVLLDDGAVVLGAAEIGRRLDAAEESFMVQECTPSAFGYGAPGGGFVALVPRGARFPAAGEAHVVLPPSSPPELLLFEGDHARVEGCEPYARLRLDSVPEGREDALHLELHVRADERGSLALEVLRSNTGTSIPYRLDPVLSDSHVAQVLAVPSETHERDEPLEAGFLDWLRNKLRPS